MPLAGSAWSEEPQVIPLQSQVIRLGLSFNWQSRIASCSTSPRRRKAFLVQAKTSTPAANIGAPSFWLAAAAASVGEVPVTWTYAASSRVDPLRDTIRMFRDVVLVRLNDLRGLYR